MKASRLVMGMPVTIVIDDASAKQSDIEAAYNYFKLVDNRYSPFKADSEVSRINDGLPAAKWSHELQSVLRLCEQTKQQTNGYFDVWRSGKLDPSGLVKGWAINNAAGILKQRGFDNFYVDAGGDIQTSGLNAAGRPWQVGIRNPFNRDEIVKVLAISNSGMATSGTYIRGQHIYDPHHQDSKITDVASLTVIGPNIYEADRFATAAFAMGRRGIDFIEQLPSFEGYMIDNDQQATLTSGLGRYLDKVAI